MMHGLKNLKCVAVVVAYFEVLFVNICVETEKQIRKKPEPE